MCDVTLWIEVSDFSAVKIRHINILFIIKEKKITQKPIVLTLFANGFTSIGFCLIFFSFVRFLIIFFSFVLWLFFHNIHCWFKQFTHTGSVKKQTRPGRNEIEFGTSRRHESSYMSRPPVSNHTVENTRPACLRRPKLSLPLRSLKLGIPVTSIHKVWINGSIFMHTRFNFYRKSRLPTGIKEQSLLHLC